MLTAHGETYTGKGNSATETQSSNSKSRPETCGTSSGRPRPNSISNNPAKATANGNVPTKFSMPPVPPIPSFLMEKLSSSTIAQLNNMHLGPASGANEKSVLDRPASTTTEANAAGGSKKSKNDVSTNATQDISTEMFNKHGNTRQRKGSRLLPYLSTVEQEISPPNNLEVEIVADVDLPDEQITMTVRELETAEQTFLQAQSAFEEGVSE